MKRTLITRGLLWLGTPLAVLGLGEFALRRAGFEYVYDEKHAILWSPEKDKAISERKVPYQFDLHELWAPRPGALLPWTNGERVNADGYRGPQLDAERPKGTLRIATLGGAGTFGVGVRWEDTYSALLARFIGEKVMPCEVLCAGVEDFSIRQSIERYVNLVRPYRPHVVILAISARISVAQAPGGLTDDEKIKRLHHYAVGDPGGGCRRGAPRLEHLANWMTDVLSGDYWIEREFQLHQKRLEQTVGALDWPGVRRVPIDDFYHSLSELMQETRQDGAHLILLSIPRSPALPELPVIDVYNRTLTEFAEREKITYLDGRNAYVQAAHDDIPKEDLFLEDLYPSECGHLQLAQALTDTIVRGINEKASRQGVVKPTPAVLDGAAVPK